jgi:hypothetical protein
VCFFIAAATAAQLPNSYIPPNRQSAGGNSQFLQTPSSGRAPSSQYGPPAGSAFGASSQQNQYASAGGKSRSADAQAVILKYENNPNTGDGSYNYEWVIIWNFWKNNKPILLFFDRFETSNGIKVQESGYNTQQGPENSEQIVTGSYSYTGDDGQVYTVTYKADANGFQPQGAHLPTPPPIPADIQKWDISSFNQ